MSSALRTLARMYTVRCPARQSRNASVYGSESPHYLIWGRQIRHKRHKFTRNRELWSSQGGHFGFNPQGDGRVIRINVPPLSGEVRQKMVARIKELAEEARVSIRNVRRDGNKVAEQAEKDKQLNEDLRDDLKNEIQELTKKHESSINNAAQNRESEVTEGTD